MISMINEVDKDSYIVRGAKKVGKTVKGLIGKEAKPKGNFFTQGVKRVKDTGQVKKLTPEQLAVATGIIGVGLAAALKKNQMSKRKAIMK